MLRHAALAAACLAVTSVIAAQGVKETVRLTVTSAGVVPLVVTDGPILGRSNVFAGTFIGELAEPPGPSHRRHRLSFDVQGMDAIKAEAYVVYYAEGDLDDGYVYLPGPDSPEYRRNISTIIRDGHDGAWHRADAAWARELNAVLPKR